MLADARRFGFVLSFCACASGPPLRLISSDTGRAAWSFVVQDRAHAAELLIDGRPRLSGCDRAGAQIRCELRGLWPGAHTVELRIPGAVLRRSVLVQKWPAQLVFARAKDADDITAAADAHASGVLLSDATAEWVELAHRRGLRVALAPATADEIAPLSERLCIDAVIGVALPAEVTRRFPSLRSLSPERDVTIIDRSQLGSIHPPTPNPGVQQL